MGYYLLDNPNTHGEHFYTARYKPLRIIVLHITAGLEDQNLIGTDHSAENTARYCATTDREVSWHAAADSDSHFNLLPASYTAWHASNYNSPSWGIEISKKDVTWADEPAKWVTATLKHAAAVIAPIVKKYSIPLRRLSRAEVDAGKSGFAYHMDLDPARRSDPGKDFPFARLIEYIQDTLEPKEWDEMATKADVKEAFREVLREDGLIPNKYDTTGKNPTISAVSALSNIHYDVNKIREEHQETNQD